MPIIAADSDDLSLQLTDFLKSRVYAKLLMRLISERYQTFNRQLEGVEANTASYRGLVNRQTGQFVCS